MDVLGDPTEGDPVENKEGKTAVYFTFGRLQPPTIGHKVVIDTLREMADDYPAPADAYVFVSSKQNDMGAYLRSKKYRTIQESGTFESSEINENPLSVYDKVKYLKKMYPDSRVSIVNTTECPPKPDGPNPGCAQILSILDKLRSVGYSDITMVVGSDQRDKFARFLTGVKVVAAGEARNESSAGTGLKGMSGTKMRMAAVRGSAADIEAFKRGVMIGAMTDEDAMELLNAIRAGLGYNPIVSGGKRKKLRLRKTMRRRRSRRSTSKFTRHG
jgi:hypothetical protein